MIFGAFFVEDCVPLRDFVKKTNRKLSLTNVLFAGKLSVRKVKNDTFLFFNVRYFLYNPSLITPFYSWLLVKGLRKQGYAFGVKRVSGVYLSELLEELL